MLVRIPPSAATCGCTININSQWPAACCFLNQDTAVAGIPGHDPQDPICVFLTCLLCSYQTTGLPVAADMQAQYMEIARALDPHVDMFLAETLSTAAEAHAAAAAAAAIAPGELLTAFGRVTDAHAPSPTQQSSRTLLVLVS